MKKKIIVGGLFALGSLLGFAQQTVGLFKNKMGVSAGYSLVAPIMYPAAYLLNNCGEAIHTWNFDKKNGPLYLLGNGNLLKASPDSNSQIKAGGVGGYVELIDWNSQVIWSYKFSDSSQVSHHDLIYLKNGNILINLWEKISQGEAIAQGRDPESISFDLLTEKIIEIEPIDEFTYNIVWEWNVRDHLIQNFDSLKPNYGVVDENLGKINLNYDKDLANGSDWLHFNSMDYDEENDLILISVRHFNEIWVVDHSTTLAESKTGFGGNYNFGGDLLFRWGNSRTYRNDLDEQQFFGQHDARWIKNEGKSFIKVFNNGYGTVEDAPFKASIDLIEVNHSMEKGFLKLPNGTFSPQNLTTVYSQPENESFYSPITSGSQYLNNKQHLLVTLGLSGKCIEIDLETNQVLWEYVNPVYTSGPREQNVIPQGVDAGDLNLLFKVIKYDENYSGIDFESLAFNPLPLEINPLENYCLILGLIYEQNIHAFSLYPTYAHDKITIRHKDIDNDRMSYAIFDTEGRIITTGILKDSNQVDTSSLKTGDYIFQHIGIGKLQARRFIKY